MHHKRSTLLRGIRLYHYCIIRRGIRSEPKPREESAKDGPVFITEHGLYAYVLLTMEEYRKIAGKRESILDLLAMPEMAEIDDDFEYPRMGG